MTKTLQFNNTQISGLDKLNKNDRLSFGGEVYSFGEIRDDGTFLFVKEPQEQGATLLTEKDAIRLFTEKEVMDFINARMMQRMIPSVLEISKTTVNTRCCN